jgi:COMPASS component SWD2
MFVTGTTELSCWVPDLSKVESFTITDPQAPSDTDTE